MSDTNEAAGASATEELADFVRRCRAYLEDAPGSGGHSDAAGSNAYELIEEAIEHCTPDPAQPSAATPSIVELASVIHDARFGEDYPIHLRNSFETEPSSGRAYCIKLARAVLDGFNVSHRDGVAQAATPPQACDGCENTGWCHANDKCYLKGVALSSTEGK